MQMFAQSRSQPLVRIVLLAALLFLSSSVSYAQSQPQVQSDRSTNIPDEKLDAAAAALSRVTAVSNIYAQRLAEAKTSSAKTDIAKELDDAMAKAITDEGISLTEYDTIIELAQNDPKVRAKLLQRVEPSRSR